ncbi:MAG TPA: hypothetical protein VIF62_12635 [Labilithrix sp.]
MRAVRRLGASIAGAMLVACSAVLGLTDPSVVDPAESGAPDAPFDVEAGSPPPDAPADAPIDAGPFCSRLDATPTFCDDFDEQPTIDSRWIDGTRQAFADASIGIVAASFASPPQALRLDLLSPSAAFPVDSNYWLRYIHPGPVATSATFTATVVIDAIVARGDAGTPTPDARIVALGDENYSIEIDLAAKTAAGPYPMTMFEGYPDAGFASHDYEFAIDFTKDLPHAILVRIDYANARVDIELDGFAATPVGTPKPFHLPAGGLDVHLDLGSKTDWPDTNAVIRYDDVVFDLR